MFEWKPNYSVQIPEIDAQHQRLFALAAELHSAMSRGEGNAVLEGCLASLLDYTKEHFAAEEQLMARYQFPRAVEHKEEHSKLTSQVFELQQKFRAGQTKLTLNVMVFLKNWLERHIGQSDQQYSAFIRSRRAA